MKLAGICFGVALIAVTASWPAAAEERNAYLGVAAGFTRSRLGKDGVDALLAGTGTSGITSVDDSDRGIKLYGGFSVLPYLALEAGYTDFGRFRFHSNRTSVGGGIFFGGDSAAYAVDFSALGTLPLGSFSLFARGGFSVWQVRANTNRTVAGGTISTSEQASGVSPLLGLGGAYRLAPHISLRLEAERHFSVGGEKTLGKRDLDLMSLAVQYHF
jgi:hypothetical protein